MNALSFMRMVDEYRTTFGGPSRELAEFRDALRTLLDDMLYQAYADGRKDEREEQRKEQILRAMNETGQGEHGVTA
jgi:hypothetical protein